MIDNAHILENLLQNPQAHVDQQWLLELLQSHPCFYLPAALLLKRNPQNVDQTVLQQMHNTVMINCADLTSIIDFVDPFNEGWDSFYPKENAIKSRTEQTIDDFIQKFGKTSASEEEEILERLIFNPVPADYLSGTEEPFDNSDPLALPTELRRDHMSGKKTKSEKVSVRDEQVDAVDSTDVQDKSSKNDTADIAGEDSLLTESLVKFFIKRHNYVRALDIIRRLSLNYPEKSVYFADQKRFLKKLIINQQSLNKKK